MKTEDLLLYGVVAAVGYALYQQNQAPAMIPAPVQAPTPVSVLAQTGGPFAGTPPLADLIQRGINRTKHMGESMRDIPIGARARVEAGNGGVRLPEYTLDDVGSFDPYR